MASLRASSRVLRGVALMFAVAASSAMTPGDASTPAVDETALVLPKILASQSLEDGHFFSVESQLEELPGFSEASSEPALADVEEEEEEEYDEDSIEYVDNPEDADKEDDDDSVRRLRARAKKVKKVTNPATKPGRSASRTFAVAPNKFACDMLSWDGPTLWKQCVNEVTGAPAPVKSVDVGYNFAKESPEVGCGQKCIAYNLQDNLGTCLGATVIAKGKCRLAICGSNTTLSANPALVSAKKAWPSKSMKPRAFFFPEECNEPEPTPSPTGAPIPYCPTDSAALNRMPSLSYKFERVPLNPARCEMTELKAPFGVRYFTQNDYACSLDTCIRWCAYDALCKYAGYSAKLKQCYKSTGTQVTDDPNRVSKYISEGWIIMALKAEEGGDRITPYYGGKCVLLVGSQCRGECGLNKGRMGYNDEKQGGSANQYCGRLTCKAVPYNP